MKIGFVLDDTLDSSDGVQQYILTLGDWLRAQKHEVHYLVGQSARTDVPNVHSLSRNIGVRFNGNRMSIPLPASNKRIKALLQTESFDVLHVQMPYSPAMGAKVIRHAPQKTRLIGTFHILPFGWLQRWGSKLLFWYQRPSLHKLQQVLSVSLPAQTFAMQLGVSSDVLPNVVASKHFSAGEKLAAYDKNFTIVFLGRLVERKGCQELLHIINDLAQRSAIPSLKVVICGAGAQLEHLQRWVVEHSLVDIVEFKGFISERQKADYLKTADLAVFPSLGGESFGIVLIEAMASGSGVVLGGNNPGYMSVLHEVPETIFDPRDTTKSSQLIETLCNDKKLRQQLHKQQQELVKKYDVAVVGKKLLSYYQRGTK